MTLFTGSLVTAAYPPAGSSADTGSDLRGARTPQLLPMAAPDVTAGYWPRWSADPLWVNGYRILTRLGAGGTADVFTAVAPDAGLVVLKLFRTRDRSIEVCRREFRMAYAVDPAVTAPPLGYGVSAAGSFIVYAHLPGYRSVAPSSDAVAPPGRLAVFGSSLARTLAAVHRRGVVHCDVKPSNLLVRGNDVRVVDFGISRYVGQIGVDLGVVECSRGWAAPEQLRNVPAAPPVDVFAWGCVLAYLAAGVHPFASGTDEEWILRVQSAPPDLCGLPPSLEPIVLAALSRDPGARPSARDLVAACAVPR